MRKNSDAVVEPGDFYRAVHEIRCAQGPDILFRLWNTEPHLAKYVEDFSAQLSNTTTADRREAMEHAMDRLLVLIRAIELGQERLWQELLPPSE